jgi:hypothetical protein
MDALGKRPLTACVLVAQVAQLGDPFLRVGCDPPERCVQVVLRAEVAEEDADRCLRLEAEAPAPPRASV